MSQALRIVTGERSARDRATGPEDTTCEKAIEQLRSCLSPDDAPCVLAHLRLGLCLAWRGTTLREADVDPDR